MKRMLRICSAVFLSLAIAAAADAATITVPTSLNPLQPGTDNQGWHREFTGNSNPTNDNYITGVSDNYRSWFAFDLSGVTGTVTSATFNVRRYEQSGDLTIGIWDVTSPIPSLPLNRGGGAMPAVFADLGSGISYGLFFVPYGGSFDVLSFTLNGAALGAANAALGGYFAIGVSVVGGPGIIFSASSDEPGNGGPGYTQDLVLETTTVPDASTTLSLMGLALAGIGALRRKFRA